MMRNLEESAETAVKRTLAKPEVTRPVVSTKTETKISGLRSLPSEDRRPEIPIKKMVWLSRRSPKAEARSQK
jgi:hypothetical protein